MDLEEVGNPRARPIHQRGQVDSILYQEKTSTVASWDSPREVGPSMVPRHARPAVSGRHFPWRRSLPRILTDEPGNQPVLVTSLLPGAPTISMHEMGMSRCQPSRLANAHQACQCCRSCQRRRPVADIP